MKPQLGIVNSPLFGEGSTRPVKIGQFKKRGRFSCQRPNLISYERRGQGNGEPLQVRVSQKVKFIELMIIIDIVIRLSV